VTLKRWPPDPLRVLVACAFLFILGAVTLVALADPVADLEEVELAAEAAEARARARAALAPELVPAPAPAPAPEPIKGPPRTKKGKILQQRLEERRAKLAAASASSGPPKLSLRSGGADAALVERLLKRKLGASFVDDSAATWALTLRVDRKPGAGVQLRCSVAVAAMPNKNLVASFSSQAGVEGDAPDAELLGDAAEACAGALAEDLGPWFKRAR